MELSGACVVEYPSDMAKRNVPNAVRTSMSKESLRTVLMSKFGGPLGPEFMNSAKSVKMITS